MEGLRLFEDVIDEMFQLELITFTETALAAGRDGRLPGKTFQVGAMAWFSNHVLSVWLFVDTFACLRVITVGLTRRLRAMGFSHRVQSGQHAASHVKCCNMEFILTRTVCNSL